MHWFGLVWISALTNLYIQAFSRFTKKQNKKQTDFTKAEASFRQFGKKRHHIEQVTPASKSHLWAKNVLIIQNERSMHTMFYGKSFLTTKIIDN